MLKPETAVRLTWADFSANSCSTQLHIALTQVQSLDNPQIQAEADWLAQRAEELCKAIARFNQNYNSDWDGPSYGDTTGA